MQITENPFDRYRTEDFNTNYKIIAQYFSDPKATYYTNLINRGNLILIGSRGSGKTMLLKSLYLPVHIEILKKEGKPPISTPLNFIGILINCERYEFKIFRENIFSYYQKKGDKEKIRNFWKQCMGHYFALIIIEEMLNTIINSGSEIGLDFSDQLYYKLFDDICDACKIQSNEYIQNRSFDSLGNILKKKRKKFSDLLNQSILHIDFSISKNRFDLSAVIEVGKILKRIPRIKNARFYILLDDFFYPNLADEQQKIVLELIRVRNEPLCFKIATIPGGMVFKDDSGFELMGRGDDFSIESIEYPELGEKSDYYKLVKEIVSNRLKGYDFTSIELFAESDDTKSEFLEKLKGKVKGGHIKPNYAGFGTLVHMSSGVIRTFLVLANKITDKWLQIKKRDKLSNSILPIPADIQTEVVNSESSLFLETIESSEQGLKISKLVYFLGNESRQKLLNNVVANEYIQCQIKNYINIKPEVQKVLTKAVADNFFHSYHLSRRTTRRGIISIKSLILNRLLTPALRIPYRDRWRMDIPAEEINKNLEDDSPIDISYHQPTSEKSDKHLFCPIISGNCGRIDPDLTGKGCFYASPIKTDWTYLAKDFFSKQFKDFDFASETPPKGDITCKICEMIHKNKFGIYELTDLNRNVVFELAFALARKKHAFVVVNSEYKFEQIDAILGQEYISYQVVEESIAEICEKKILPVIKAKAKPWNALAIENFSVEPNDNSIFLVMPSHSPYYEKTLTKEVKNIIESNLGFKVYESTKYTSGNWFINLIKDVLNSKYCIIDTTRLSNSNYTNGRRFNDKQLDYLQRIFIFGLAVGLRKKILHSYNSAYTKKIFTDMQGYCHFEYTDSNLFEKIKELVPEVFNE